MFTNKRALLFHVLLCLILVAYNMGKCGVLSMHAKKNMTCKDSILKTMENGRLNHVLPIRILGLSNPVNRNVRFITYLQMMNKS